MLIHRSCHSRILNVRSSRESECDTDHSLMVAKVRERLAGSKQATQKFDVVRFRAPPDRREIFAAMAMMTILPKFHMDCGKEIPVVIHTNASVLW